MNVTPLIEAEALSRSLFKTVYCEYPGIYAVTTPVVAWTPQGIEVWNKQDIKKVPMFTLTAEVPVADIFTKRLAELLTDEEHKVMFPMMDAAMDVGNNKISCMPLENVHQKLVFAAHTKFYERGLTLRNTFSPDDNCAIGVAEKEFAGTWFVYKEWTKVAESGGIATYQGSFGCIMQPNGIVGVYSPSLT